MADTKFKLKVELTFSYTDIETIINSVNRFLDKPITMQEVQDSSSLQAFLVDALKNTTEEIVDGSHEAINNDWLCNISEYR